MSTDKNGQPDSSVGLAEPEIELQRPEPPLPNLVEQTTLEPKAEESAPPPPPAQTITPEGKQKKRPLIIVAVILVVLGLVGFGYWQRERLLKLLPTRAGDQPASGQAPTGANIKAELKVLYWQDPMHPAYKSDKPGKAPDCGMDLVPVYESGTGQTTANLPEGAFQISPEKQQLIGVQYGEVTYKPVFKTLRTVGRLVYDETKIARIHTKIDGWIEKVSVDFTGKLVKQGQPLISIYSPELLQTQQEFLLARRGRDELAASPFREAVAGSESLYQAARKRLELWDISDEQIAELEKSGKPTKALTLYAPTDGFVLTRNAFTKQRVTPDTELYIIADLSTIWVIADVYEYEAPEIKVGQAVNVTLAYYPGRTFRGKVSNILPQLDNQTRTLKVRIELPNPEFALKPDMYVNAELKIDYGKRLVVPQEAVLDSGSEQTIFIAHEGGYFEPRKVQLGAKVDNTFIVLGGLKAGERVVTSANFLIDSESKLKSAASGMGMPGMNHGGGGAAGEKKALPKESQPTPQVDHSQHQPSGQPVPTVKPEDHSQHEAKPERKILYWYDSMNPAYKSDKPGKAPDGMDLVPKYADEKKKQ